MQVTKIQNNTTNFRGTLEPTKALEEFKAGLNDFQKYLFEQNIKRMEKENDGRVFKFDYLENGRVGILEKLTNPMTKPWFPIITSPKEKPTWCFNELNMYYRNKTH